IDMRIDAASIGNIIPVDVPLVADAAYGLDDLTAAVAQLMTPALKQRASARAEEARRFHDKAKGLRDLVMKNPDWDRAPMLADRGRHSRVIEKVPGGRMVQTRQFYHDYLGNPDMNMALIAKGFGVDAEVVQAPEDLSAALERARKATQEGKPYLIDAQVARVGVAWADKPWTPPI